MRNTADDPSTEPDAGTVGRRADRRAGRRWIAALACLLVAVASAHVFVLVAEPRPEFWGDEGHYVLKARLDAEAGRRSLLPGHLGFDHQPELFVRVLSLFMGSGPYRSISILHIVLLQIVLVLTFVQARLLGLSGPGALVAVALLGLFPWHGFHVHSLWPEMLFGFFFALVLTCLLAFGRSGRAAWLVGAGAATAYALFTKSVLSPFLPLIALFAGCVGFREAAALAPRRRWLRAAGTAALYLASVLAVAAPQLVRNWRDGHGLRLAASTWTNMELGVTAAGGPEMREKSKRYYTTSLDVVNRERMAKERTLAYVREHGLPAVAAAQARKLVRCLFRSRSAFENSLGRKARWGDPPPRWLAVLETPARLHWYALLALGAVGVATRVRESFSWAFLSLFSIGFVLLLLAVPLKVRFALPLVPVLCLFGGAVIERLAERVAALSGRGRRGAPRTPPAGGRGAP